MSKLLLLSFLFIAFLAYLNYRDSAESVSNVVEVTPSVTPIPTLKPVSADKLFQSVNNWRLENGYQPYIKSEFACSVALQRLPEVKSEWSHDLFLEHTSRGDYCESCYLAENLVKEFLTAEEALSAWINSPSHREILEMPYSHSCIICDNTSSNYCVHTFSYY